MYHLWNSYFILVFFYHYRGFYALILLGSFRLNFSRFIFKFGKRTILGRRWLFIIRCRTQIKLILPLFLKVFGTRCWYLISTIFFTAWRLCMWINLFIHCKWGRTFTFSCILYFLSLNKLFLIQMRLHLAARNIYIPLFWGYSGTFWIFFAIILGIFLTIILLLTQIFLLLEKIFSFVDDISLVVVFDNFPWLGVMEIIFGFKQVNNNFVSRIRVHKFLGWRAWLSLLNMIFEIKHLLNNGKFLLNFLL